MQKRNTTHFKDQVPSFISHFCAKSSFIVHSHHAPHPIQMFMNVGHQKPLFKILPHISHNDVYRSNSKSYIIRNQQIVLKFHFLSQCTTSHIDQSYYNTAVCNEKNILLM